MSYTFLAATGAESSVESFAEMFQSAPWKSIQDAGRFCYKGKEMESFRGFQSGTTLKLLMENRGGESRKSSKADFHAPTFHPPEPTITLTESSADLMAKARDCGLKWSESLRKFNLELSVLKTPPICELRDLCESSRDLTAWGMMQDGACLGVADSAQTISEEGFSSLLPTPTAHNSKEGAYPAEYTRKTPTLAAQVGGRINPDWNEWRMGCPTKWSDLNPLGIDKFRQWLNLHGKPLVHEVSPI